MVRAQPFYVTRPQCSTSVGLFETSSDVDNCARRVAEMVDSLESDAEGYFTKRYGSSVTFLSSTMVYVNLKSPEPKSFADDQNFYRSWRGFFNSFKAWKKDWDDRIVSILSADTYRECTKWDLEAKAWWDRFAARGIKPTGPKTTTPSGIPGITPDQPPDQPSSGIPWGWLTFGVVLIGAGLVFRSFA